MPTQMRSERVSTSPHEGESSEPARSLGCADRMDAIASLYDEHAPRTFHYLVALLGNRAEAEDALQGIFLEIVRRPHFLKEVQSPRTYLLTMARNWVFRARQTSTRRREVELEAGQTRLLKARDPLVHGDDEMVMLETAILALPEEQREVLVLKIFEDLTFREVATVLGISENTAASRYRYALGKLREGIRGTGDGHGH